MKIYSLMTNEMIEQIKQVMMQARANVAQTVNNELIAAYWNIGRIIVEHEQENNERAEMVFFDIILNNISLLRE